MHERPVRSEGAQIPRRVADVLYDISRWGRHVTNGGEAEM
jgi:hypothetical protein